jgi:ubiquitin-protein ligase
MYSRAHILIQKEISEITNSSEFIINKLNENSLFELIAQIDGLPNTIWKNGAFQIYLKFDENYNLVPPKVFFQTIPYHPNIDMTSGRPSLDFLDDLNKWKTDYTIKYILRSLQQLLAFPLLDRAVNMNAVFMFKGNQIQYENIVKQSVIASQRIKKVLRENFSENNSVKDFEDEFTSQRSDQDNFLTANAKFPLFRFKKEFTNENSNLSNNSENAKVNKNAFKNISYDDYCVLWKGIATSKLNNKEEPFYLKNNLFENQNLLPQHISISLKDLEEQVLKQLTEHKNIMYGKFDFGDKKNDLSKILIEGKNQSKKNNTNYIENINSQKFQSDHHNPNKEKMSNNQALSMINQEDDIFEKEVDDLINWTKNI